jgi:class 3 adenylate cyclase/tetratricopeptide (TPR) repeat protein
VRCAECGQETSAGAKFCNGCGAPHRAACPSCGALNPATSRFCGECGSAQRGEPAAPRFVSPESYTPPHLAEKILTSRAALEGERKQVTVLFADMKGSMELLADRDPEEARKLLDPVLERLMAAVHRYEGTVNQVMGDGIMALFGAPLAHEDHAARACYAAVAMHEDIRRYTEELRRSQGLEIQIRVGLHSGEVVVRTIGSDLRMDYSAVGQTTHLAARMEQLAAPGSTRLTADTVRLAEGFVQVASLGPVPVKGVAEPVEVFELQGAATRRTRLQAAADRGLTRFVGRQAELGQLRESFERARTGRGQVVAVVGEPGVGKSRLFWELLHSHRLHGALVLQTTAVAYSKATPYSSVVDLVRVYFGIEPGDDARLAREKVTGRVLALDEALRPVLPALLALLDVPGAGDAGWERLGQSARRAATADAIKAVLLRESQTRPLVLVFEDLHWVDGESQHVMDGLVAGLPAAPIFVLLNYRPEYAHPWGNKTYYTQLRLDPLQPETADELLRAVLGESRELAGVKRLLIERTDGNPFFLEESVRTLLELGLLAGERGAYRPARPVESIQIPPTVQALVAARIDRLQPEEKHVLQTAAVIGKDLLFSVLRDIVDVPEDAQHLALSRLQAAEFLYERTVFPELEYTFKHALTHEVAYNGLLQERRRALHARVVDAFERLYPDRRAERLPWLALHAFRGEVWGKALLYLRRAIGDTPDPLEVVTAPGGPGHYWWSGDHARAREAALRDLAISRSFRGFQLQTTALLRLGQIHHSLGDFPRAIGFLQQNVENLEGDLRLDHLGMPGLPSVTTRTWLAWSLVECGRLAEATEHAETGLAIAETAAHARSLILASMGLGVAQMAAGRLEAAAVTLERALVLDQVEDIPTLFPFVAAPLGCVYARLGRTADGVALLERALAQAEALKLAANLSRAIVWLGQAHLLGGRGDRARELAERALAHARERGERAHEAWALHLRATAAGTGAGESAAAYREALALATELGMETLRAACAVALAG